MSRQEAQGCSPSFSAALQPKVLPSMLALAFGAACLSFPWSRFPGKAYVPSNVQRSAPVRAVSLQTNDNFDVHRGARSLGGIIGAVTGNKMYHAVHGRVNPTSRLDETLIPKPIESPKLEAPDLTSLSAPDVQDDFWSLQAPDLPSAQAPDLPNAQAPDLPGVKVPDLTGFKAPDLSGFKAPDLSGFKAPDLSGIQAPDFSNVKLPEAPAIPDLSSLTSSLDSALGSLSTTAVPPASASEASEAALTSLSVLDHSAFFAVADASGGGLPWGAILTVGFGAVGALGFDYCVTNKEPFGAGSGILHSLAVHCGKYTDLATQKAWEIAKPAGEKALLAAKQAVLG